MGVDLNKPGLYRASIELLTLFACSWLAAVLIDPTTPGINVNPFGLKWFVVTFLERGLIFVGGPFFLIFFALWVLTRAILRKVDYWKSYRTALYAAAIWTVLGNYGLLYGKCRSDAPIPICKVLWFVP